MAKPRVFVSSTYEDQRHVRANLEKFIKGYGYEATLFERGNIPFIHGEKLDTSCYKEVDSCDMFILIVGGRYGSAATGEDTTKAEYESITRKEFQKALDKGKPRFIFVERSVWTEMRHSKVTVIMTV